MSDPKLPDQHRTTPRARPADPTRHPFRTGVALLAVILLLVLLWQLRHVLLLIFAAALIGIVLSGCTAAIRRHIAMPRPIALALSVLLTVGGAVAIGWLFGAELSKQLNQLVALIPAGWNDLSARLGEQRLEGMVERLAPSGSNIFSIISTIVSLISGILTALLLAILGGVFLAAQPQTYRTGFRALLPKGWEAKADETLDEVGTALRRFLLGQAVSVTFVGVSIFLGLWLVGAPSPLALAVIAGILGFIPVIGPLMAAAPGILVALTMGGDAIWQIALVYFIVQQTDGNLVNAIVMKHSVKIPPAVTMFSLFAIGAIFGPTGLILGGPIAVLGFVLVRRLWVREHLGKPIEPIG